MPPSSFSAPLLIIIAQSLKYQLSILKYVRVPLASVYLVITQWHSQNTPLLGHSLKNKILIVAVSGLNSDFLSISVFTIKLTGTPHVCTFQAVFSATKSGSSCSTTVLHQFRNSLGCRGKDGWDSLQWSLDTG